MKRIDYIVLTYFTRLEIEHVMRLLTVSMPEVKTHLDDEGTLSRRLSLYFPEGTTDLALFNAGALVGSLFANQAAKKAVTY